MCPGDMLFGQFAKRRLEMYGDLRQGHHCDCSVPSEVKEVSKELYSS